MSRKRQKHKKQKKSNLAQYMARSERNPMEGSKKRVTAMLSRMGKRGAEQGAKIAKMTNGLGSKQSTLPSTSKEQSSGTSEMNSSSGKSMAGPSKRKCIESNVHTSTGGKSTVVTKNHSCDNTEGGERHSPKPSSTVTEIFSKTGSESPSRPSAYLDEAPWYELPPGPLTAGLILGFVITLALMTGGWW